MLLRAIGVYHITEDKRIIEENSAEKSNYGGELKEFEMKIFPKISADIFAGKINFENQEPYIYTVVEPKKNLLCVLVTSRKLDGLERAFLVKNIICVHMAPASVDASLQDILRNPLGYIASEVKFKKIDDELLRAIEEMKGNIDPLIERGDKLTVLVETTDDIKRDSNVLKLKAIEIRARGTCCRYL